MREGRWCCQREIFDECNVETEMYNTCGKENRICMRAWEVMLVKRERENETVPCNVGERSEGSSDTRGEWRGGGAGNADGRGRGIEDGVVTEPKGKRAQQNPKNSGQNEANDQQRQNRKDNRQTRRDAKGVRTHHIPRDRSHARPG